MATALGSRVFNPGALRQSIVWRNPILRPIVLLNHNNKMICWGIDQRKLDDSAVFGHTCHFSSIGSHQTQLSSSLLLILAHASPTWTPYHLFTAAFSLNLLAACCFTKRLLFLSCFLMSLRKSCIWKDVKATVASAKTDRSCSTYHCNTQVLLPGGKARSYPGTIN